MQSAQSAFRNFLRSRRLKFTPERQVIVQTVEKFSRPFEAEELLLQLRQFNHRISKATVYRTLKHLVDARLLNPVFFGAGRQSYYDFRGGGRDHDHLVDVETGMILPFENAQIDALCDQIAARLGYHAISHRFQIIGRRMNPPR